MKKLLFVTALLAMGTMAMGANPKTGYSQQANVQVQAQIVDDQFTITDIYGKPIVVDFGKLYNNQTTSAVTFVEYKVTSKEAAIKKPIEFTIALGGKTAADQKTEVTISTDKAAPNGSMKAVLGLSEYAGEIKAGARDYIGRIDGTLANSEITGKPVGLYVGATQLEITVK